MPKNQSGKSNEKCEIIKIKTIFLIWRQNFHYTLLLMIYL